MMSVTSVSNKKCVFLTTVLLSSTQNSTCRMKEIILRRWYHVLLLVIIVLGTQASINRTLTTGKRNPEDLKKALSMQTPQSRTNNSIYHAKQEPLALPNVLIIGAQKAGTSAVSAWLFQNRVCHANPKKDDPSYYQKELHFFNTDNRYRKGPAFYAEHYEHCQRRGSQFIMDATPDYERHADRVYETYKEYPQLLQQLKLILLVREPLARDKSIYNHMAGNQTWIFKHPENGFQYNPRVVKKRYGNITHLRTWPEFIQEDLLQRKDAPELGYYAFHLKRWFQLFDPQQILVLSYEQDVKPGTPAKQKIQEFLKAQFVDPTGPFPSSNTKVLLATQVTCKDRDRLQQIYSQWNQEFYDLMDQYQDNRPPMETVPFPKFELHPCVTSYLRL
jgi:Sulfotransferase domain